MRQTHIKQQTQKAESEWRTVQSSKTKKTIKTISLNEADLDVER